MGTGFRATFVMSWSQTEVDGLRAAPVSMIAPGAAWRWTGQAVRVDGVPEILPLTGAEGGAELRARAARMVRRLVGEAVHGAVPKPAMAGAEAMVDRGFVLTDGRTCHVATVIEVADTGARLVMFAGDLPPPDTDLWIVRSSLGDAPVADPATQAGVICFTPGTLLRTAGGSVRIEDLRPGDRIQTRDDGPQEVLWTGRRRMTGARLYAMPHLRPVRFRAGAMGVGRPDRDLLVSPRHRMLVRGPAARALFNAEEVLVAAADLVNGGSITVDLAAREVTYVHVLLERHEVVWANGLATESFHPGAAALDTLDPHDRFALEAILPEVAGDPMAYGDFARRCLTTAEAAILRHDLAA
ncbi:MAG: Hint domain-containing protein [Paracoccaceae bacterium]|nr:MAG: Hint domain-containing protein [Paracoccaceae bacterium]